VYSAQLSLLGDEDPKLDPGFSGMRRVWLDSEAWVDHLPGWVAGHQRLFDALEKSLRWREEQRAMYGRIVGVPRLYAIVPDDGIGDPLLYDMRSLLSSRYDCIFERISVSLYRDGRDSVAWHGDRIARNMAEAMVATVSVGAPRRFLLRPKTGGKSLSMSLGHGDLLVMGGTCQRTWQHCVPKVREAAPRIAIMFRPRWADY
jgi:alkylated DNA repair dioxygenase AlkB